MTVGSFLFLKEQIKDIIIICGGSVGRRYSAVCILVGFQRGRGGGRQLRGIAQAAPKTVRGREYTIGGGMLATR
jgi:hypothetical protein